MSDSNQQNQQTIETFYQAFKKFDGDAMADCYHPEISFSDPVFPQLEGEQAGNMWRMLCQRVKGTPFELTFSDIWANENEGGCNWEAKYLFSRTGKQVHNIISAQFKFKDGKIIQHKDDFNFWRWSRMALGAAGYVLGWTPILQKKVQAQAEEGLRQFENKQ